MDSQEIVKELNYNLITSRIYALLSNTTNDIDLNSLDEHLKKSCNVKKEKNRINEEIFYYIIKRNNNNKKDILSTFNDMFEYIEKSYFDDDILKFVLYLFLPNRITNDFVKINELFFSVLTNKTENVISCVIKKIVAAKNLTNSISYIKNALLIVEKFVKKDEHIINIIKNIILNDTIEKNASIMTEIFFIVNNNIKDKSYKNNIINILFKIIIQNINNICDKNILSSTICLIEFFYYINFDALKLLINRFIPDEITDNFVNINKTFFLSLKDRNENVINLVIQKIISAKNKTNSILYIKNALFIVRYIVKNDAYKANIIEMVIENDTIKKDICIIDRMLDIINNTVNDKFYKNYAKNMMITLLPYENNVFFIYNDQYIENSKKYKDRHLCIMHTVLEGLNIDSKIIYDLEELCCLNDDISVDKKIDEILTKNNIYQLLSLFFKVDKENYEIINNKYIVLTSNNEQKISNIIKYYGTIENILNNEINDDSKYIISSIGTKLKHAVVEKYINVLENEYINYIKDNNLNKKYSDVEDIQYIIFNQLNDSITNTKTIKNNICTKFSERCLKVENIKTEIYEKIDMFNKENSEITIKKLPNMSMEYFLFDRFQNDSLEISLNDRNIINNYNESSDDSSKSITSNGIANLSIY